MEKKKLKKNRKNGLKGKTSANNFNLQYDISPFDSFILLFDINGEMRVYLRSVDMYVLVGFLWCTWLLGSHIERSEDRMS